MKNQTKLWIAAVILPVAAHAAGSISKPVLGYVFEPSARTIRAIAGVPGAAVLDETLSSATKLDRAHIAPGRSFAIVEFAGGGAPVLLRWNGADSAQTPLEGAGQGVALTAFSGGEFAAIYYKESGRIQVWRGLPDAPALSRTLDAGDVRSLAISDDGELVAAAHETGIALFEGTEARVIAGGEFPSVEFLPGTRDLIAVEPALERVVRISGGEISEFAAVKAPRALAASRDGKWVAVTAADGLYVAKAGQVVAASDTSLEIRAALRGDSVFLLGDKDGGVWVLDMDSGEPRLVLAGGVE